MSQREIVNRWNLKFMKTSQSKWYVYIVECKDGSLYTGITTDVDQRIETHNKGKGAKYTRGRRPVTLIYKSHQMSKSEAASTEFSIKKQGAGQYLKCIKQIIIA